VTSEVLITGASGFLGRHVARAFAEEGHRVVGLGRAPWTESEWRAWGLSGWLCAEVNLETLRAIAEAPEFIVPCAGSGSVGFSFKSPLADFEATVGTLGSTLEYMRLCAPEARLVYPSSAAVYGQVEQLPIRENTPFRPMSPYGSHKLMAEQLCRSYAQHFGLRVALVRFFSLYGPGLRKQLLWDACVKFAHGEASFLGTGQEARDWVHVTDGAQLLKVAAAHADVHCRVVNGASEVGTTVLEALTLLRTAFPGAPPLAFTREAKVGDPSAYRGDGSQARAWGWAPSIDIEEGVAEYAAWFRREHP